jgi:hypothetical protein
VEVCKICFIKMEGIVSGSIIQLTDVKFGSQLRYLVEVVKSGTSTACNDQQTPISSLEDGLQIVLSQESNPFARLHLLPGSETNQGVVFKPSSSPNSDTLLSFYKVNNDKIDGSKRVMIGTVKSKKAKSSYYLAVDSNCCVQSIPHSGAVEFLNKCESSESSPSHLASHPYSKLSYEFIYDILPFNCNLSFDRSPSNNSEIRRSRYLKRWQAWRFLNEGYLHLPQMLRSSAIDSINALLLHYLGKYNFMIPGGIQGSEFVKYPGSISNSEKIRSLLTQTSHYQNNTTLIQILEEMFGHKVHDVDHLNAQIAFRFPELISEDVNDWGNQKNLPRSENIGKSLITVIYSIINPSVNRMAYGQLQTRLCTFL